MSPVGVLDLWTGPVQCLQEQINIKETLLQILHGEDNNIDISKRKKAHKTYDTLQVLQLAVLRFTTPFDLVKTRVNLRSHWLKDL